MLEKKGFISQIGHFFEYYWGLPNLDCRFIEFLSEQNGYKILSRYFRLILYF